MLSAQFFNRDAKTVAKDLLGKVIQVKHENLWLFANIIETEAYYLIDKGSHASLGYTQKRSALFMSPGTIYMYYARGGDSLNISCKGKGNAVLIKSGMPYINPTHTDSMLKVMHRLNPKKNNIIEKRDTNLLCAGQTLLCRSLGLRVTDWDQKNFDRDHFYIKHIDYRPRKIIQTRRLGIPIGRDEDLLYRFIDYDRAAYCTNNPLRKIKWKKDIDYYILNNA